MNKKPIDRHLLARLMQVAVVKLNALLARLPLELNVNRMSSVSWNG
jgi:hypothetical protein